MESSSNTEFITGFIISSSPTLSPMMPVNLCIGTANETKTHINISSIRGHSLTTQGKVDEIPIVETTSPPDGTSICKEYRKDLSVSEMNKMTLSVGESSVHDQTLRVSMASYTTNADVCDNGEAAETYHDNGRAITIIGPCTGPVSPIVVR